MNVPLAWIVRTSPSSASTAMARRTVTRLTPCSACSWLSLGSMSVHSPLAMPARRIAASCSHSGVGSRWSTVTPARVSNVRPDLSFPYGPYVWPVCYVVSKKAARPRAALADRAWAPDLLGGPEPWTKSFTCRRVHTAIAPGRPSSRAVTGPSTPAVSSAPTSVPVSASSLVCCTSPSGGLPSRYQQPGLGRARGGCALTPTRTARACTGSRPGEVCPRAAAAPGVAERQARVTAATAVLADFLRWTAGTTVSSHGAGDWQAWADRLAAHLGHLIEATSR